MTSNFIPISAGWKCFGSGIALVFRKPVRLFCWVAAVIGGLALANMEDTFISYFMVLVFPFLSMAILITVFHSTQVEEKLSFNKLNKNIYKIIGIGIILFLIMALLVALYLLLGPILLYSIDGQPSILEMIQDSVVFQVLSLIPFTGFFFAPFLVMQRNASVLGSYFGSMGACFKNCVPLFINGVICVVCLSPVLLVFVLLSETPYIKPIFISLFSVLCTFLFANYYKLCEAIFPEHDGRFCPCGGGAEGEGCVVKSESSPSP